MTDRLAELSDAVETFVTERDWSRFHTPMNLAMGVAIEAAEIMEHFQWCTGEASRARRRSASRWPTKSATC